MIDDILQGIVNALFSAFGASYKIYTERVEQGLQEPCFFVQCLNPAFNLDLGRRYKSTQQFCIQYFPQVQNSKSECISIMQTLFDCLENITVNQKVLHSTNLNAQFTDGIVNCFVNYDVFLLKTATTEVAMQTVSVETEGH